MNYFDYNANKHLPRENRKSSLASFDVIDPPDYWVTEHGPIGDDAWERLTQAAREVA